MDVSLDGKNYLTLVIEASEAKTLRFYGISGCCGVNFGVGLDEAHESDEIITIDGLTVAIDPQVKSQLAGVTIHAEEENGEIGLVLLGYQQKSC
ncbi:Fe-S cluster assembly protein HesB [Peribacillus sp. FSL H8-0477]|uniref:Fe-S cluster assembly protein HesB n=1 Tax=Peribacillus sp. FSL H8-0477 TaxID=2921388 RepID=UPI0030F7EEDD